MKNEVPGNRFDFIGDIHGHAGKLVEMLTLLGYSNWNGSYAHPSRKAFFIGDYIDRGPQVIHTLEIVKGMVDNNNAIALMGNHEYNALCFHYHAPGGNHLRKHQLKISYNILKHLSSFRTGRRNMNRI